MDDSVEGGRPRKPDRRPTVLVFPAKGRGRVRVEDRALPREQKALELAIGKMFQATLLEQDGLVLTDLRSGDGRGDLIVALGAAREVKIQVAESVDQVLLRLGQERRAYRALVERFLEERAERFGGCVVEIVDDGGSPFLPNLRSRARAQASEQLLSAVDALASNVRDYPVGRRTVTDVNIQPNGPQVGLICTRHVPAGQGVPYRFHWGGSRRVEPNEIGPVTQTVAAKIAKAYSKPPGPFWLLVYSTDHPIGKEDAEATFSLLQERPHPFDKVWFLFPFNLPLKETGGLTALWPRDPAPGAHF